MFTLFFLFLLKNIDCGYSLEPPRRGGSGGSNEYSQSMFRAETWKISEFLSEYFQFWVVKFSIYLNRRVFVLNFRLILIKWTVTWENEPSDICAQRRLRSACASIQTYQSLHYPHEVILHHLLSEMRTVKILIRLRECMLSDVSAQIILFKF